MRVSLKSLFLLLVLGAFLASPPCVASAQSDRGKGVPLDRLPVELRELSPQDRFIPSSQKRAGVVHAVEGTVVVIHGTTREAYFGMAGDPVYEKDSLVTLAASKCRIRFVDEDVVTMAPETEFSVESFEDQRAEGRKSSFFKMLKGRAMFYAMRLFRYRETRLTLATPTSTIGVRGTKFGAHVYYLENAGTASGPILVADARDDMSPYLLAQAGAGRSFTDCFSEDGVLDVDGQAVAPGQMYSSRTGQVTPTPPEVIRSFQQATEIRTEGAAEGGQHRDEAAEQASETAVPPPAAAVTGGVAPMVADIQENITSVVQVQTGAQTETKELVEPAPRRDIGYFAAMLTNTESSGSLKDVFIQFDDHVRYGIDTARGKGLAEEGSYIEGRAMGVSDVAPYLSRVYLGSSADSGDLGTTRLIEDTSIGNNEYMKWGYWTMTDPVAADSTPKYVINNKAYYLVGQATEDLDRIRNLGEVTYQGGSWGTYWSSAGGTDLSGSFETKVNLGSGSLTGFKMELRDQSANVKARIQDASGVLYGHANPGNNGCGHFDIDPGSGTWELNGATGGLKKAAQGALYGPDAQHIGGVWGMYRDSSEGAAGIFKGSRP